jgi:hypothetical protein
MGSISQKLGFAQGSLAPATRYAGVNASLSRNRCVRRPAATKHVSPVAPRPGVRESAGCKSPDWINMNSREERARGRHTNVIDLYSMLRQINSKLNHSLPLTVVRPPITPPALARVRLCCERSPSSSQYKNSQAAFAKGVYGSQHMA